MQVTVNGQEREVSGEATLEELIASLGASDGGRGVAVAVSGEVVPRSEWGQTALHPGDRLEVLIAVQGG